MECHKEILTRFQNLEKEELRVLHSTAGEERAKQEEQWYVTTHGVQWFLRGVAAGGDIYQLVTNIDGKGYDFYYCHELEEWNREHLFDHAVTEVDFVEDMALGVIENDFHDRKDLSPNVCAVYTEEAHRGQGIAGKLLNLVVEDMRKKGVSPLYLVTDHTGFYERYGWEFYCMAQGDGEPDQTRLYIHK